MQNALDKAGDTDTLRKVLDDRDSTITSLRQQLEEAEDRLVRSVLVPVRHLCVDLQEYHMLMRA